MNDQANLPILLKPEEVADLLRTSRDAIYTMNQRGQLPGGTRIGRRLLFRRDNVLEWLEERRAPSAEELRR
ncbi:MAG: helix-turn-helix domain-containing protein [Candidatus Eisenbacteria sp.]|nr:helix-turn-helix domain-containing protein [Candidatus Eisenbacteria bacterium]